jgi:mono/diheme cytochrome c family protein
MMNLNDQFKLRTFLLFVIPLVFLLSGCGSETPPRPAQPVSAPAIAAGDVENGRDLFMGYVHFQNGGPPCMGCHSVGNNGLLGGGAMGPDLTNVSTEMNQTSLVSILSNFGPNISPVMEPIYTEHPLTVSEQADLIAFLIASEGQTETDRELIVVGISMAGFVAGTVLLGIIYRGRMRGARRPLVNKAQKELL